MEVRPPTITELVYEVSLLLNALYAFCYLNEKNQNLKKIWDFCHSLSLEDVGNVHALWQFQMDEQTLGFPFFIDLEKQAKLRITIQRLKKLNTLTAAKSAKSIQGPQRLTHTLMMCERRWRHCLNLLREVELDDVEISLELFENYKKRLRQLDLLVSDYKSASTGQKAKMLLQNKS